MDDKVETNGETCTMEMTDQLDGALLSRTTCIDVEVQRKQEDNVLDWLEDRRIFEHLQRRTNHADFNQKYNMCQTIVEFWREKFRKFSEKFKEKDQKTPRKVNIEILLKWEKQLDPIDTQNNILLKFLNNSNWTGKPRVDKREFRRQLCQFSKEINQTQLEDLKTRLAQIAHAQEFRYWPPKPFTTFMTISHVIVFIWWEKYDEERYQLAEGKGELAGCSRLVLNPYRPHDAWRYFSYSFIHNGPTHLLVNIGGLIITTMFLEFTNKWWRLAIVYFSGVIFASVTLTALWPTPLVGMSAGVYALITASLADLYLNWADDTVLLKQSRPTNFRKTRAVGDKSDTTNSNDSFCVGFCNDLFRPTQIRYLRLGFTVFWLILDIVKTVYEVQNTCHDSLCDTSYAAHVVGAITGILVGILILKNRRMEVEEIIVQNLLKVILPIYFITLLIVTMAKCTTDKNEYSFYYSSENCTKKVIFGKGSCCLGFWSGTDCHDME